MIELICKICGNKYFVKKYRKDKSKFCSKFCAIKALNDYKKTEKWLTAVTKFNRENKPHLGKQHSKETRIKMSEHNLKYPRRYWLGKKNPHHEGSNNINWKGGITSENEKSRKCLEYKEWRKKVFERDKYMCRICNAHGYIQANHILPFRSHKEERHNIDNGITLCIPCHKFIFMREELFIKLFQGIIENGFNSAKLSKETTPSQQEELRKVLWACVTVKGE